MSNEDKLIAYIEEVSAKMEPDQRDCPNCDNLGALNLSLGLYWAERRCHYCEDYCNWASVTNLLSVIRNSEPEQQVV